MKMIEENILKCLKKQDMTIEEVSNKINISRSTASKYLLVLETKGFVRCREIGRAKLFSLK
ncbi:MAG: winged helix-turn-helix domain-containing protein [Candidatus Aenigmatarchaeota archaeon]